MPFSPSAITGTQLGRAHWMIIVVIVFVAMGCTVAISTPESSRNGPVETVEPPEQLPRLVSFQRNGSILTVGVAAKFNSGCLTIKAFDDHGTSYSSGCHGHQSGTPPATPPSLRSVRSLKIEMPASAPLAKMLIEVGLGATRPTYEVPVIDGIPQTQPLVKPVVEWNSHLSEITQDSWESVGQFLEARLVTVSKVSGGTGTRIHLETRNTDYNPASLLILDVAAQYSSGRVALMKTSCTVDGNTYKFGLSYICRTDMAEQGTSKLSIAFDAGGDSPAIVTIQWQAREESRGRREYYSMINMR